MRSGSRKKSSRAGSTSAKSRRSRARNRAATASLVPASHRRKKAPTRWRWKSAYPMRSAWSSVSMRAVKAVSSASAIAISISSTIWAGAWRKSSVKDVEVLSLFLLRLFLREDRVPVLLVGGADRFLAFASAIARRSRGTRLAAVGLGLCFGLGLGCGFTRSAFVLRGGLALWNGTGFGCFVLAGHGLS